MQIIRTIARLPPIIVIHGQPGVGKTTLAQNFPKPVFVQTEDGRPSGLELETFGLCDTFTSVERPTLLRRSRDERDPAAMLHYDLTIIANAITQLGEIGGALNVIAGAIESTPRSANNLNTRQLPTGKSQQLVKEHYHDYE
jgi:GTPase SAR1 family protein